MAVVDLRYARALDTVVAERGLSRDAVKAQLGDFLATLTGSAPLREVFENPSIPEEQKLRVLDGLGERLQFDQTVRNFIAVVMRNMRLEELHTMIAAYLERADEDSGIAEAEITSARPLLDEDKRALEQSVAQLAGGSGIRATYREDPALLGGAVVRVGSTVYDGSVRGQLEQLKQRMVSATT